MCRWLAYRGEPVYLEELIYKPAHSLIEQSVRATEAKTPTNGDGFGIGWYGAREQPGLYREVLPVWNDRNLRSLAYQIRSSLFFAHVRASTGTETIRPNCHPFALGRWLYMHNGQIGGYERVRRKLESLIPDAYYAQRLGTTDSELIFLLLLARGLEEDPAEAIQATMVEIELTMRDAAVRAPLRFTAALTDGKRVYATRYASDAKPPSLYYCTEDDQMIIVSEPLESQGRDWQPLPVNHLLTIDENSRSSIAELAA